MNIKQIKKQFSVEQLSQMYDKSGSIKGLGEALQISQGTASRLLSEVGIQKKANIGNRKHKVNDDFFSNIDDQKKAYWLGFLYADGCVYQGTGNSYRLQINLKGGDFEHLRKFVKDIDSTCEVTFSEVNGYSVSTVKINSTKMCLDLIDKGCIPNKSLLLQFPSEDILPKHLVNHFLRGYFDGDGNVTMSLNNSFKKSFSICGGSFDFINAASSLLDLDVYQKSENLFVASTSKKEKICDIYNLIYKDESICLARKKYAFDILNYVLISPIVK